MKKFALVFLILASSCRRHELPIGEWLWRVDGPWTQAPRRTDIKIAPVTVIVFRPDHEYVELHCWVLERPDDTVYVATNSPRISVVGEWQRSWNKVTIVRKGVAVPPRFGGSIDTYCKPTSYTIEERSVRGDVSGKGEGLYAPVTRLVAPDFEYYVKEARNSPQRCAPSK
jgi:hypothetical protein